MWAKIVYIKSKIILIRKKWKYEKRKLQTCRIKESCFKYEKKKRNKNWSVGIIEINVEKREMKMNK